MAKMMDPVSQVQYSIEKIVRAGHLRQLSRQCYKGKHIVTCCRVTNSLGQLHFETRLLIFLFFFTLQSPKLVDEMLKGCCVPSSIKYLDFCSQQYFLLSKVGATPTYHT